MASNNELVAVARKITEKAAQAEQYRILARPLPLSSAARSELYTLAVQADDAVDAACAEMRRLARLPVGQEAA